MKKKIHINKTKDFQIGNVRVDGATFHKIETIAEENNVSNQTIVREILVNFIDDVIIKS